MAGAGLELGEVQPPLEPPQPELAFTEAQKWIEQVTGRSFGEKDFRSGLENGILLCELLNAIKPGLVKKINRLPTPIAGLGLGEFIALLQFLEQSPQELRQLLQRLCERVAHIIVGSSQDKVGGLNFSLDLGSCFSTTE